MGLRPNRTEENCEFRDASESDRQFSEGDDYGRGSGRCYGEHPWPFGDDDDVHRMFIASLLGQQSLRVRGTTVASEYVGTLAHL